jgi:hypothetical protein
MARTKSIPDADVLAAVRTLQAEGGDKAVSFGSVAQRTRLAPSTLAQRFGTVAAMLRAAHLNGWARLTEDTATALEQAADKGPQGLLKALEGLAAPALPLRLAATDDESRALSEGWRKMVETALAQRLGQGEKAREAAAILFAAWQGQMLWGGEGFRIKDAAKRLG